MSDHWSSNGLHWAVNNKIFESEQEALKWCKDLMGRGVIRSIRETMAPVTHRYLGDGVMEKI